MPSRCCARAVNGQAAADPTTPLMRSRRRIACPEAQDYANYIRDLPPAKWGSEAWLHGSKFELRMSALGQKRTCAAHQAMSALPPKSDIKRDIWECPLLAESGHVRLRVAAVLSSHKHLIARPELKLADGCQAIRL